MSETVNTPTTTDERKQFLFDVFVTALEGGIDYWFISTTYHHAKPDPEDTGSGSFEGKCYDLDGFFARGHEDGESKRLTINAATVEKGLYLIRNGGSDLNAAGKALHMHHALRAKVIGAEGVLNANDIDAELADCIVQIGLFGEVIYG